MPDTQLAEENLQIALAALKKDYSKLAPRIRRLVHQISCTCDQVTLHLHYPAIRQGKATIFELVQVIFDYIVPFCISRSEISALTDEYGKIDADEFGRRYLQLSETARHLFKKANKATNRNGEAGELLLYLMTEWVLEAPQLVAKMSLKTNTEMPVHGADGIHVKWNKDTSRLMFYWGESKLYSNIGDAVATAIKSIGEALKPEKIAHELLLVQNTISLSGMPIEARTALLEYLNPYSENSNLKIDVTTCLIGFSFDAYEDKSVKSGASSDENFEQMAILKLKELAPVISKSLTNAGLQEHPMEIFLFPVPSVKNMRDMFQEKIGWNN